MKSFETGLIDRLPIGHELLRSVSVLSQYKGKEALFKEQIPQALETLRQTAIIQSTESSNRIEGVTAPLARIQAIVQKDSKPRDRSEKEIAGYKDVLALIHARHEGMKLSSNLVLQLHRDLFRLSDSPGGSWKAADNAIEEIHPDGSRIVRFKPVAAFATPEFMDRLHEEFTRRWNEEKIDRLILIPAYVLDFLCIHPFRDGNGRIGRLLTLLLLYQAGHEVGRFISLERVIERTKETYYEALQRSSQGWHEGQHDPVPWIDYFLGVLIGAYREFEERVGSLSSARGAKTQMVLSAIERLPSRFRMADLERLCPNVTREMIRKVLKPLKKNGQLSVEGAGVAAVWLKGGTKS